MGEEPKPGAVFYHLVRSKLRLQKEIFCIGAVGLDVYLQRDFLTSEEREILIDAIDEENEPSLVLGHKGPIDFRSSYSSSLRGALSGLVPEISRRIDDFLDIPARYGEPLGGVRYAVGQEFRPHFDWFHSDSPYWPAQEAAGGQRTWSVVICLNKPESGGGTMFPDAGIRLHPRPGNLIAWCNLDAHGVPNPMSLHCGEPVLTGAKYILTKWYRVRTFNPPNDFESQWDTKEEPLEPSLCESIMKISACGGL